MPKTSPEADPTERDAVAMVRDVLGVEVDTIVRFSNGLRHFVYDVTLVDSCRIVARISRPDDATAAAGAVYWSGLLRPKGVPLLELLHADLTMARAPFHSCF